MVFLKKVKTGIIGFGRLGRKHALDILYHIPGAELTAVCSVVESELAAAGEWGIPGLYTDHREMLEKEHIDAVIIVSPSTMHYQHVLDCAAAGVHIFCEKPLALTLEHCIEMEKAAENMEEAGKIFMLGFMRRFDPSYSRLKKKLDNGELGKPIVFKGNSLDPMSGIEEYLGFARKSGGIFLDMALHDIDLALWYLGEEAESVYAYGSAMVTPQVQEFGDNDNAFAILKFKNGSAAILHAGRTAPNGYQVDAELTCTERTVRVNNIPRLDRLEELCGEGVLVECEQRFFERFNEAYKIEKEVFFDCILYNQKSPAPASQGTLAARIALAATESMSTGKVVRI